MDRFVCILRTEDALTARVVKQRLAADFTDAEAVAQALAGKTAPWYELADSPLTHLPTALFPTRDLLLEAWDALSHAVSPDTDAVKQVLTQTVLGQPASSAPPPLTTLPAPAKPTAAHPRAYAGTTYQPPTPKAAAAQDWRAALCDPRLLGTLASDAGLQVADLHLPPRFRTSLYPLVWGQGEAAVAEALSLYWAMALDQDAERLAATAYFLSLQPSQNACAWGRLILTQAPEHWTPLLHLLIASGVDTTDVRHLPPLLAEMLSEVLHGKDPFYRAYWLLHGVATQLDPAYLLAGYRLADTLEQTYTFHEVRHSGYCSTSALLRWGGHCRDADDFYTGTLLSLWEQCGLQPGLGEHLEQADYAALTPSAAYRWLKLLRGSWDNGGALSEAEADAKWAAVQSRLGVMMALVQSVPPEYQVKCVEHLAEYLWQWNTPAELQAGLPSAFILTQKLCRSPFARKSDLAFVTVDFLAHLPAALRECFLEAPDASFKRLEQACRRDNDANLIGWGTWALTRHQAEFAVRCFESEPERLFHAAKRLGTLPAPIRDACVRGFTASPGEALRPALARLEQAAIDALSAGFPAAVRAQAEPHALQMQQMIDDNRKALRKFLLAHWQGHTGYRQTHPLTQRWLAAHPAVLLETWQRGVTLRTETELGGVTLSVEQNPLEALKLGTYVGSCLGLGGSFAHSAAAVVLDINKQVVYARNGRGAVVGRQLVAVSEANQLVCYEVYPLSAQEKLASAFAEFDAHLAAALALPLYRQEQTEDYEIAHILSHAWWDDGAWNLAVAGE